MRTTAQSRALCTCVVMALGFTAFSIRLVHLQVTKHEEYVAQAAEKHTDRQTIYARRGTIVDAHGESLALNEPVRTVIADASLIKDRDAVAALLAGPLEMSVAALREKLAREVFSKTLNRKAPAQYIVLKKDVPEAVAKGIADEMAARKMRGIAFEHDTTRVYPNNRMLCHVIGYTNGEGAGMDGIERNLDSYLRGQHGFRYIERDGSGRELVQFRGQERTASNGSNVRLTVDMGLQNIVETELEAACKIYNPLSATVVLMEPKTGAILAMANRPNFDLNDQRGVKEEVRRNRAVTDPVEPGSTFKIVTTAAALDQRLVNARTMIFCENRYWSWCKLHDSSAHAYLSVNDVLVKSSNIGVAKLAIQMGDQKFYEYVRRFGFGERTGVNLPWESPGIVHLPHTWSKISITRMPMGHEVNATPLQIASAMSVIANGGQLMMPQIVSEVADDQGKSIAAFPPRLVRQVVSKRATEAVRDAMLEVVTSKGTASGARVFGHLVAGKTGTSQKIEKEGGSYTHSKYVSSFVGYIPANDPAFVAVVIFDEPKTKPGQYYGGIVAAPVFSRIAERAVRYLGIVPTEDKFQGEKGTALASQIQQYRAQ